MVKTISLSDEVYARLEALAKPFEDRDPEDVIRRLLNGGITKEMAKAEPSGRSTTSEPAIVRAPRERGTVVELRW